MIQSGTQNLYTRAPPDITTLHYRINVPAHTIFASNTSSISLTALAAVTKRPERVVGMHFFSPVPKMRLCEVIFGLLTAQDVLDQIKEVGHRMGKTLILSDDKPEIGRASCRERV